MRFSRLLSTAVLAVSAALVCSSCVSDDWDDYDSDSYRRRDDYYRRRDYRDDWHRHRHDDEWRDDRHHRHGDRRDRPHVPGGFAHAGNYSAGGAVEVGVPGGKPISKVLIACTSGSVAVNTVVVREGAAKTPVTVSVRIPAGETRTIELGGRRNATGLRISTGGKGSYEVYVR